MEQTAVDQPADASRKTQPGKSKNSIFAGSFGNVVEWYDWTVYAVMAPFFAGLFFPSEDPVAALLATYATFAIGFFFRPLGGIFLTPLGDKYGRKTLLAFTVGGMALGSLIIGLTPGYATIGIAAPIILILARVLQGLAAGAEWGNAATFLTEHGGRFRRGFTGSFMTWGCAIGVLFATIGAWGVGALTEQGASAWIWRIPFILGGLLGLVGLYVRSKADESETFKETGAIAIKDRAKEFRPGFRALIHHRGAAVRVFFMSGAFQLGLYMFAISLPSYGRLVSDADPTAMLAVHSGILVLFACALPIVGKLSDNPRVGRKPVLLVSTVLMIVLPIPLMLMMQGTGLLAFALVSVLGMAGVLGLSAMAGSVFAEQFPPEVRASGLGLPVALSVALFAGTISMISTASAPQGAAGAIQLGSWIAAVNIACLIAVLLTPETSPAKLTQKK